MDTEFNKKKRKTNFKAALCIFTFLDLTFLFSVVCFLYLVEIAYAFYIHLISSSHATENFRLKISSHF